MKASIRLGLQIPSFTFPGVSPDELFERLTEIASTAESSGFDSLFVMDHLHQMAGVGPRPPGYSKGTRSSQRSQPAPSGCTSG